ncbi:hypothetical protein O1W68_11810 [Rhodococcus sp. H36-A4]|uniref:hypothetical protein n=1 Tax=Rhodococcus sp. H36-A4 TaxID=3004353 RepID=UPI0022B06DA1|nr:hypothetical protein [Rhodococcus sp. H36-A4]MCZ4078630.1 hypothetical protein [Rhodococcus sp. H36-A4]
MNIAAPAGIVTVDLYTAVEVPMSITTERPRALTSLAAAGRSADGRSADGRSAGGRSAGGRDTLDRDTLDRTARSASSVRTSRPRTSCASLERRHYLHTAAPQSGGNRFVDQSSADRRFDDETSGQTISWTATIAGVLLTVIVLLGLVGLANLRAGHLDSGAAGDVAVVEHGGFFGTTVQDLATATDSGQ